MKRFELFMKRFTVSIMMVFAIAGLSHAENIVTVTDAWVREVPPASSVTAAYLKIENKGNEDDTLTGVSTDVAGVAEIHVTSVDDKGVAKMEMRDELDIPAGEVVELKPGGAHIMLIDLKEPVSGKDNIELSLTFAKAGEIKVEARVMGMDDNHEHHNH